MGNIGRIVKNDCSNPHKNPSTSISMCQIYVQRSKHKNAISDDKCGIEILMPNTKYAWINLERTCNNDVILDIIHDKIFAKRILIFHYLCRWYETISLIKDHSNINIKHNFKCLRSFLYGINTLTTQFSMFRIYCVEIFLLYKPIATEFITTVATTFLPLQ